MSVAQEFRDGEQTADLPSVTDAELFFIGRIRTPWADRVACPRRGDPNDGPVCRAELDPRWLPALDRLERGATLELLYWMHFARRDLVRQNPKHGGGALFGTFALRSPMRPNPIAVSQVRLIEFEGSTLLVRGLDCVDGTPLLDIKPILCPMWPRDVTDAAR